MVASSHRLAVALATRLNKVVPPPFRLVPQADLLYVYRGPALESVQSLEIVDDESRDPSERLETAVLSVINTLQDDISEHMRTPWPSHDGRAMALAEARSDGKSVHIWYGDRQAPVLTIPPISIDEIIEPDSGLPISQ